MEFDKAPCVKSAQRGALREITIDRPTLVSTLTRRGRH